MQLSIREDRNYISKKEWSFVGILILILLLISSIPYIYGYISEPEDHQFMGLLLNVSDHTQYFSWYREFKSSFLIENKLTPETNVPVFFNLLWWALAKVSVLTGLELLTIFQIFRLLAGALFILSVYWFCAMYFEEIWERKIATLIITCGAGFGWLLVFLKYTVTHGQLIFPEDVHGRYGTNSFLSVMSFPHFTIANTLVLLTLMLVLIGYRKRKFIFSLLAAIVSLILSWQHAYDLITIYSVLFVFTLFEGIKTRKIPWYLIKSGLVVFIFSCWAAFYSVYITNAYPIWEQVLAQFVNAGVYTADPFHMVIVMGFPLILAILTFDGIVPLKEKTSQEVLIKTWFIVTFFVGYLPTVFQVHLTNGWQIPIGILATYGLFRHIIPYIQDLTANWSIKWRDRNKLSMYVSIILVILILPTNIYLIAWRFLDLSRHDYPYFLYKDDISALSWLEDNTKESNIVLSSRTIGQYIPSISGNKAFLAHWAQTVDFFGKSEMVEHFFDAETSEDYRVNLLSEYNVQYVLHGEAEKALGRYDPSASPFLVEVFSSPRTRIYSVNLK